MIHNSIGNKGKRPVFRQCMHFFPTEQCLINCIYVRAIRRTFHIFDSLNDFTNVAGDVILRFV